jgi:hypothetical protein
MKKKFSLDTAVANALACVMGAGALLMILPTLINGFPGQFATHLGSAIIPIAILWFGFARGSYVTIEGNVKLYGTFFIRGSVTHLSDVISIGQRYRFGTMSEIFLKYRKKDGSVGDKGIVSKQSMKRRDFRRLINTIQTANPKIEIDPGLLGKEKAL